MFGGAGTRSPSPLIAARGMDSTSKDKDASGPIEGSRQEELSEGHFSSGGATGLDSGVGRQIGARRAEAGFITCAPRLQAAQLAVRTTGRRGQQRRMTTITVSRRGSSMTVTPAAGKRPDGHRQPSAENKGRLRFRRSAVIAPTDLDRGRRRRFSGMVYREYVQVTRATSVASGTLGQPQRQLRRSLCGSFSCGVILQLLAGRGARQSVSTNKRRRRTEHRNPSSKGPAPVRTRWPSRLPGAWNTVRQYCQVQSQIAQP